MPTLFVCVTFSRWTLAGSSVLELLSEESSDDCARGGDTSSSRSQGRAGEEESEVHYTAEVRKTPPPQPELFSLYEEARRFPATLSG